MTPIAKADLVKEFAQTVEILARTIHAKYRQYTNVEDLMQAGYEGLFQAADRYDGRALLPTFANPRIRGAMLDHARREKRASRVVAAMRRRLSTNEHAQPSSASAARISLAERATQLIHGVSAAYAVHDLEQGNPETLCADHEALQKLEQALTQLAPREREAIQLGVCEGLSTGQIAERWGTDKSRPPHARARAVRRLRRLLSDTEETDEAGNGGEA